MIKKIVILFILLLFCMLPTFGITFFLDEVDKKLEMKLVFEEEVHYSILDRKINIGAPGLDVGIDIVKEPFGLKTSLDLSQMFTGNYDQILEELYLIYDLPWDLTLNVGQFKVPFGEEVFLGKGKRPYLSHSEASGKITPGYKRGFSVETGKILDFLKIETGLFSGKGIDTDTSSLKELLPAVKADFDIQAGMFLDIRLTYSTFLSMDFTPLVQYNLGQGVSGLVHLNFGKKNDLNLFVEFLEEFKNAAVANNSPYWSHGLFAYGGYELGILEPYVTYEHYKKDTLVSTTKDKQIITGGINIYPAGALRFQVDYRWEYIYLLNNSDHDIGFFMYYEL